MRNVMDYFELAKDIVSAQRMARDIEKECDESIRRNAVICECCKMPMMGKEAEEIEKAGRTHFVCDDCFLDLAN
jgi:hypothetical protein